MKRVLFKVPGDFFDIKIIGCLYKRRIPLFNLPNQFSQDIRAMTQYFNTFHELPGQDASTEVLGKVLASVNLAAVGRVYSLFQSAEIFGADIMELS